MKNKLFKTLTIFGLSLQMLEVDQQSWLLNTGSQVFLIVPNGTGTYTVTDAFSNPVGTFNTATKSISDAAGNTTVVSVDLSSLPIVNPDKTITYPDGSKTTLTGEPISSGVTVNSSSATTPGTVVVLSSSSVYNPGTPAVSSSSAKTSTPVASSSSQKTQQPVASSSSQQPKSSATTSNKQCDGQCFDSASGKCVAYYDQLTGSKGEKYAYDNDCKVNCYYDPENKNCQNMTGSTPSQQPKSSSSVKSSSSQQQQQAKSSSSQQQQQPKSSSSQPKSSSSQQQQQNNPNASAEEAKYLNAGAGGQQGFATRYWDCCMPHCSWPEHGGAAKTCDAKGKTPIGNTNGSICSGGQGTNSPTHSQQLRVTTPHAASASPSPSPVPASTKPRQTTRLSRARPSS